MSTTSLDGKVAIVTGAGAGLGRAEALALADAGARVVLNDLPGGADGTAEEIRSRGGEASIVAGDVGERATADAMIAAAVDGFGRLDVVVNNAGITRDRMLFNMSDEEWDQVIHIHLRGHFLLSRNAAAYWRALAKESGPVDASVVNTASEAFLSGPPGQANYGAAKAGIAALTVSTARAMASSGVRANAICPRARTAMTAQVFGEDESGMEVDPYSPEHVAPVVAYLASDAAGRHHRPGLRRVRRHGGARRGPGRRGALRQGRQPLDGRRPRQAARRLLHRPRPRRRLRRRLDHEAEGLR